MHSLVHIHYRSVIFCFWLWNFNNPSKVLSGEEFFNGMMEMVEILSVIWNQLGDGIANVVSIEGAVGSSLFFRALGTTIGMPVSKRCIGFSCPGNDDGNASGGVSVPPLAQQVSKRCIDCNISCCILRKAFQQILPRTLWLYTSHLDLPTFMPK